MKACHTGSGDGIPRLFPRLRGNAVVQSDNISTITRVVLLEQPGRRDGRCADWPRHAAVWLAPQ